jgi:hypothetical protein
VQPARTIARLLTQEETRHANGAGAHRGHECKEAWDALSLEGGMLSSPLKRS